MLVMPCAHPTVIPGAQGMGYHACADLAGRAAAPGAHALARNTRVCVRAARRVVQVGGRPAGRRGVQGSGGARAHVRGQGARGQARPAGESAMGSADSCAAAHGPLQQGVVRATPTASLALDTHHTWGSTPRAPYRGPCCQLPQSMRPCPPCSHCV